MNKHFDVAIIGSGPAGTACALSLKNAGLSVLLLDKENFPRDKFCGDTIPGPFFKTLDQVNPDCTSAIMRDLNRKRITATLNVINHENISIGWNLYAINCERQIFDDYLLKLVMQETNSTLMQGIRVVNVKDLTDYMEIELQDGVILTASIVVGCDGANSIVKRKLAKPFKSESYESTAVRCYFDQVHFERSGENEIYVLDELIPGYLWIFPLERKKANVGIGVLSSFLDKKEKTISIKEMFAKALKNPKIAKRLEGAIPLEEPKVFVLPLGNKNRVISGNRFMLCGDAASLIDPLGGHGIDNAMISGMHAAACIREAFEKQEFGNQFMKLYDKRVYQELGNRFDMASRVVTWVTKFPFLLRIFAVLLKQKKFVRLAKKYL